MVKRFFIIQLIILVGFSVQLFGQSLSVHDLTVNFKRNPMGTTQNPRFSWKLKSDLRNTVQESYSISVSTNPEFTHENLVWETGKVNSSQSVLIPYTGKELKSGEKYFWRVEVWDNHGNKSGWSKELAWWQTGRLDKSEWKAKWIQGVDVVDSINGPALYFRKKFESRGKIVSATLYATSHGMYDPFMNGQRIGDSYFAPGWTSYSKRLQYQVYDVTELIKAGENVIGASVASGWFRTRISNHRELWGKKLSLYMQLEVKYENGKTEYICTDDSWKVTDKGPIRFSELYDGEFYDATMENTGWLSPAYDEAHWKKVETLNISVQNLISTEIEPVREIETISPKRVFQTPKGEWVVDFGQNMVGWVELSISGKTGTTIQIWHGEILDKDGNFYNGNLRTAKQKNTYILKGKGKEVFHPSFTFQGFRYIKVEGFPDRPKQENFKGIVLHSDLSVTGSFECSNPLLNQLYQNILWTQKGNFLEVPTDCPQRDERLGWTGDAQLFLKTAMFNMNVYSFFSKWLKDLAVDQSPEGKIPPVVPNILENFGGSSAGWADAAMIIPWHLYLHYGDTLILKNQYESMKAYVDFLLDNSTGHLRNKSHHFGDWLFYSPVNDRSGKAAVTEKDLLGQSFFAHSTQLLVNAAKTLNKIDDVEYYSIELNKIKAAFMQEFVSPNGRLTSNTQTAYSLALAFDLFPENMRDKAVERLIKNINDYQGHITTGIVGTSYISNVLTRYGKTDIAYKMLLKETNPGWLYQVKKGATTIWERWDGIQEDGSFQTASMNSFNHYALGSIGNWIYNTIAGIQRDADAPGGRNMIIHPIPGGGITSAKGIYDSPYGEIVSQWEIIDSAFVLKVSVPANSTAVVYLPSEEAGKIAEKGNIKTKSKEMKILSSAEGYTKILIGSGDYTFEINNDTD